MDYPTGGQLHSMRYYGGPIYDGPIYVQPPYNMQMGNRDYSTPCPVVQSSSLNDPPPPYSQSLGARPEASSFMPAAIPAPRRDRFIPIYAARNFPPPEHEIGLNFRIGVLQVSGFGADVRPNEIAMVLGDEVPILDIGWGSGIPAIHILQDRCTGRTLDAYVEYASMDDAIQVLKNFDARAARGRDIKLGIYRAKVTLTSMTEMMKAIFARADCRWGNGLPEYQIPVYLGFFGGFIIKEEMHRMLNLAQHPSNPRNIAARECPDRVYHFAISSLAKIPWNAQAREHWFSEGWLQELVDTYEKMAIKLAHEIKDQHFLRLDIKLLTHFMYALRHSPLLCRTQPGIERFNIIANRVDGILAPIAFINPAERLAAARQRGAVDSPAFAKLQNVGKHRESVINPVTPTGPAAGNYDRLMRTPVNSSPTPCGQQGTPVHARASPATPIPRGPAAMYKAINSHRPGLMPVYPTNHLHGLYPRQSPPPVSSSAVALPVALSDVPTPCRSPNCDRAHLAKLTYPLLSEQANEYSQLKPTELVPPVKYLPTSFQDELQAAHRLSDPFQVNDWRSRAMTIANPVQAPQPTSSPEWTRVNNHKSNITKEIHEDSEGARKDLEIKPVHGHRPAASFSGWQVNKKWKRKGPKASRTQDNRFKFLAEMSDIEEANSSSGYLSSDDGGGGGGVALGGLEKFPAFDPEYGVEEQG